MTGYCNGYNRRRPFASVLVIEPDEHALGPTVDRYLARFSFVVAALPARAAEAAAMFAFDGIVLSPRLAPHEHAALIAIPGRRCRGDDPIVVARELAGSRRRSSWQNATGRPVA